MDLLSRSISTTRNRTKIIAREMGWTKISGADDWSAEVDALSTKIGDRKLTKLRFGSRTNLAKRLRTTSFIGRPSP